MNIDTVDVGVRTGKVDILHRTDCQLSIVCIAVILDAIVINNDNLAWFYVANPLSTDRLQRSQVSDEPLLLH